ncbi:Ig-like domain-containing protein, partial [Arthrospira platensis SPKY1]|nr:Ig-like domain-containing protein [Arthrospira platensis SPKY1]
MQDADQAEAAFVPDVAGLYIVQLIVSDGLLDSAPDTATVTVVVPEPVNRAPQITSSPVTTATVGQPYTYPVTATDPDGDPLRYALLVAPAGMTVVADSGLIEWLPAT